MFSFPSGAYFKMFYANKEIKDFEIGFLQNIQCNLLVKEIIFEFRIIRMQVDLQRKENTIQQLLKQRDEEKALKEDERKQKDEALTRSDNYAQLLRICLPV